MAVHLQVLPALRERAPRGGLGRRGAARRRLRLAVPLLVWSVLLLKLLLLLLLFCRYALLKLGDHYHLLFILL